MQVSKRNKNRSVQSCFYLNTRVFYCRWTMVSRKRGVSFVDGRSGWTFYSEASEKFPLTSTGLTPLVSTRLTDHSDCTTSERLKVSEGCRGLYVCYNPPTPHQTFNKDNISFDLFSCSCWTRLWGRFFCRTPQKQLTSEASDYLLLTVLWCSVSKNRR